MEGLINSSDKEIWEFAKKNKYTIVTQDTDIIMNLEYCYWDFRPKIIWIRTGNQKTNAVLMALIQNVAEIEIFLQDENYGCFEIFSLRKI